MPDLLVLLKRLEWGGEAEFCPVCRMHQHDGHARGCEVAAALAPPPAQPEESRRREEAVCLDFDGVVHLYEQPWTTADEVRDGPVPGALEAVGAYVGAGLKVYIQSVRAAGPGGRVAIERWLLLWGARERWLLEGLVQVVSEKPKALMYVDDRGYRFAGSFPTPDEVRAARPWNRLRREAHL